VRLAEAKAVEFGPRVDEGSLHEKRPASRNPTEANYPQSTSSGNIYGAQQLITEGKSDRHFYQTHLREVFDSQEIEMDLKEIEFKRKVAERINELDARAEQLDTQEEQLFQKLRLAEEQHDAKLTEAKEKHQHHLREQSRIAVEAASAAAAEAAAQYDTTILAREATLSVAEYEIHARREELERESARMTGLLAQAERDALAAAERLKYLEEYCVEEDAALEKRRFELDRREATLSSPANELGMTHVSSKTVAEKLTNVDNRASPSQTVTRKRKRVNGAQVERFCDPGHPSQDSAAQKTDRQMTDRQRKSLGAKVMSALRFATGIGTEQDDMCANHTSRRTGATLSGALDEDFPAEADINKAASLQATCSGSRKEIGTHKGSKSTEKGISKRSVPVLSTAASPAKTKGRSTARTKQPSLSVVPKTNSNVNKAKRVQSAVLQTSSQVLKKDDGETEAANPIIQNVPLRRSARISRL